MTTLTLDDAVYAALARRAAERNLSVERFLAEELAGDPPAAAPPDPVPGADPADIGTADAYDPAKVPPPVPGESLYDAFMRHGAIGCIKGGPPDVATNPKYMEGFGKS